MKKTDKQIIKELRAENKELKRLVDFQTDLIKTHEGNYAVPLEQVKKWEAVYKQLWGEYEKNLEEISLLKAKDVDNSALIKDYDRTCKNYKDLNEHKTNEIDILTKELTLSKIRINKLIDNLK